ncbi:MAG TPA: S9 family peptidase, partial [Nannocystaceae bacterium]|nr:S9 family peptidase [Nannocystaceae bacterium]
GSAFAPQFAPDGESIAYLGRREGESTTQVYRIAIAGGEAERLTDTRTSVRELEWSPDGNAIAYTTEVEPTAEEKAAKIAGRDWKLGDVDGTRRQLFVLTLGDDEAKAVTPREFHVERFRWSPRGDAFALVGGERADVDATMMYGGVFEVARAGGVPQRLCPTQGKLGTLAWSPDGSTVAFLGASDLHDPTPGVVFTVPAAGGKARARTLAYAGTGQWLAFTGNDTLVVLANEGTQSAVQRLSLRDDALARVTKDGPVCHDVDVARQGTVLACAGDTAEHPAELFVGSTRGGKLRRLSHSNPQLERKRLGAQQVVKWNGPDGLEIAGVLTKPVGWSARTRYPLVVLPHGGPEGISLAGWNTRAGYPAQLFATRGYMVLEPNYRGSSGRGVAFGKADQKDLGGKEFADVLAGIDMLVEQGLVDPERVGMGGWSYGGYFSGLAATQHTKRFRAAMVGAAITDWMSFTGTTEIEHENSLVHWNLWPYDEHELAWMRSPMAHTKGAKTATLVVHGLDDSRVPPEQAKELYRALRHAGVTTELVLYPREGHGLAERAHQIDFVGRYLDWFDEHLAPTTAK